MKVYVLEEGEYSDRGIVGIYSTLEKAKEKSKVPEHMWKDFGNGTWGSGARVSEWGTFRFDHHYSIDEYEVDA